MVTKKLGFVGFGFFWFWLSSNRVGHITLIFNCIQLMVRMCSGSKFTETRYLKLSNTVTLVNTPAKVSPLSLTYFSHHNHTFHLLKSARDQQQYDNKQDCFQIPMLGKSFLSNQMLSHERMMLHILIAYSIRSSPSSTAARWPLIFSSLIFLHL